VLLLSFSLPLQERAEVSRLRRALSEATAAGEREYLDLEEQLAEAERSRAAAAARVAELEAQLQQQSRGQSPEHPQQLQPGEDLQQLQQQVLDQATELELLRQQGQQPQHGSADQDGLQVLQQRVQEVSMQIQVQQLQNCWCVCCL
jgi:hypothetical protein